MFDKDSHAAVVGGSGAFLRAFTRLGCHSRPPQFSVNFYPYANLVHTIRLRGDLAEVRLSDILKNAPLGVIEAVAAVLLSRLYRRKAPRDMTEAYRRYAIARSTRRRLFQTRSRRGRRSETGPRGDAHDLAPMFSKLNREYFGGRLHRPALGWSSRAWRAQLGCFDPGLDQIVMNTRLDRQTVPAYVVEYVLYHEMLHVKHPLRAASCGLQAHSAAFRAEERRFALYKRALTFLDRMS